MAARKKGRKVPPTSIPRIRDVANDVRKSLGLGLKKIDMVKFVEFVLPQALPGFYYEILPKEKMGGDEARTYPDKLRMEIREDVYLEAIDGDRRAPFTLAHELGHLILHSGISEQLSFARNETEHKVFEDSEWQADTFAAEFLMPFDAAIKCKNAEEISEKFGVSLTAAEVRFKKIN